MITTTHRTASAPLMILTKFSSKTIPPEDEVEFDLVLYLIGGIATMR